jgi:hypothetical protein
VDYEYEIFKRSDGFIYLLYSTDRGLMEPLYPESDAEVFESEGIARLSAISHMQMINKKRA